MKTLDSLDALEIRTPREQSKALGLYVRRRIYAPMAVLVVWTTLSAYSIPSAAQETNAPNQQSPVYKRANLPIEQRVDDLLSRMTVEEKARQLDLYAGALSLVDRHEDETHATQSARFVPDKAQVMWGDLGVGAIHDLNPTVDQANAIQRWVIDHNRLGIPALFIEEGLHGFDTGTVFPAPIGLAATWSREIVQKVAAVIAAEARSTGV